MRESARRLLRHLSSLLFPLLTLGFVATGPHRAIAGAARHRCSSSPWSCFDRRARGATCAAARRRVRWPFTALAVALALDAAGDAGAPHRA